MDGEAAGTREVELGEMRLEVVVLPVSDVQVTPPGSPCSVIFGRDVTAGVPGAVQEITTRLPGR